MKKSLLLASVAFLSLGAASQAQAFDSVNWEWNKLIDEQVIIDTNIFTELNPTGSVEIEKIQMNIGDINATSTVSGIDNNPPGASEDGTVFVDETITVSVSYEDPDGVGNTVDDGGALITDDGDTPLTTTFLGGQLSEQANGFNDIIDLQFTGELDIESVEGINDAVDLPEIESSATAVANNQSIESSVGVQLHDAQYNWGGFSEDDRQLVSPELLGEAFDATGNTHTDILLSAALSGALGIITPGSVTATSTVSDISNASVDSDATAVGNNLSVDVAAFTPDDALVIADLTQFNYADVNALSSVTGVSVDNYANLGVLEGPLVSSVATAVGNNVSITVSSPDGGDL